MAPPDSLADLVARAGSGDRDALAAVYDATCARVHGLALHVLGDADEASEVVRETFAELARPSSPYDPGACSASAWVVAIAHRRAVARRRAQRGSDAAAADLLPVRQLPEPGRSVLRLAYVEGRSCREIARITDVTPQAAALRLRAALLDLRRRR